MMKKLLLATTGDDELQLQRLTTPSAAPRVAEVFETSCQLHGGSRSSCYCWPSVPRTTKLSLQGDILTLYGANGKVERLVQLDKDRQEVKMQGSTALTIAGPDAASKLSLQLASREAAQEFYDKLTVAQCWKQEVHSALTTPRTTPRGDAFSRLKSGGLLQEADSSRQKEQLQSLCGKLLVSDQRVQALEIELAEARQAGDAAHAAGELKELRVELEASRERAAYEAENAAQWKAELDSCRRAMAEHDDATFALADHREELRRLRSERDAACLRADVAASEAQQAVADAESRRQALEEATSNMSMLSKQATEAQARARAAGDEVNKMRSELGVVRASVDAHGSTIAGLRRELEWANARAAAAEQKMADTAAEMNQARSESATLRAACRVQEVASRVVAATHSATSALERTKLLAESVSPASKDMDQDAWDSTDQLWNLADISDDMSPARRSGNGVPADLQIKVCMAAAADGPLATNGAFETPAAQTTPSPETVCLGSLASPLRSRGGSPLRVSANVTPLRRRSPDDQESPEQASIRSTIDQLRSRAKERTAASSPWKTEAVIERLRQRAKDRPQFDEAFAKQYPYLARLAEAPVSPTKQA
eukprot:TRINITY_DN14833_c0_g1_i1.p1 TRINITY_DN14833_c0_g1~~TRINITY_DN14833_c0_g1_i1.p1  ORF type:complete len:600 (+),score=151.35 TRINITY_DN14833_c0_g1_i1:266-2065(+)